MYKMQRIGNRFGWFRVRPFSSFFPKMKGENRMRTCHASLLAVAGFLLAVSSVHAGYTFTNVADTTTAAPSGTFVEAN